MNADFNQKIERNPNEFLQVSNTINIFSFNNDNEKPKFSNVDMDQQDKCVDTNDLFNENNFDIENLKKNYLNNMISWQFLRKLSDFHQWPLGCIGSFIENSTKMKVETHNIHIDVKFFDKYVYKTEKLDNYSINLMSVTRDNAEKPINNEKFEVNPQEIDFKEKILV